MRTVENNKTGQEILVLMLVVMRQTSQAAHFTVNAAQEEFYWRGREGKTRRDMELWSSGSWEQ